MRRKRNMFQMKAQDKTPGELSKVETSNLPHKELKAVTIKTLCEPGRRMMSRVRSSAKS